MKTLTIIMLVVVVLISGCCPTTETAPPPSEVSPVPTGSLTPSPTPAPSVDTNLPNFPGDMPVSLYPTRYGVLVYPRGVTQKRNYTSDGVRTFTLGGTKSTLVYGAYWKEGSYSKSLHPNTCYWVGDSAFQVKIQRNADKTWSVFVSVCTPNEPLPTSVSTEIESMGTPVAMAKKLSFPKDMPQSLLPNNIGNQTVPKDPGQVQIDQSDNKKATVSLHNLKKITYGAFWDGNQTIKIIEAGTCYETIQGRFEVSITESEETWVVSTLACK